jgi:acetolactate synthase small subunit
MKSSTKILPLTQTIDKGRTPAAAGTREAVNRLQTIRMENEDLLADVRDARLVVDVATEAWTEENEQTASSCVGVLQLIDYKLHMIECALQGINGMDRTREAMS